MHCLALSMIPQVVPAPVAEFPVPAARCGRAPRGRRPTIAGSRTTACRPPRRRRPEAAPVRVVGRSVSSPWGVNSISFGSPHVHPIEVHRTCGQPNEIKKNTHPKHIIAFSVASRPGRNAGRLPGGQLPEAHVPRQGLLMAGCCPPPSAAAMCTQMAKRLAIARHA